MIFVDTSVWIEYFRRKDSPVVVPLNQLLDEDQVALSAVVWLELLTGARKSELPKLTRVMSALPKFFPSEQTWLRIQDWISISVIRGQRFSVTDLLIASISADYKGRLWSLDSDFRRMKTLGFISLFEFH